MRSRSHSWTNILTKLGFRRRKRRSAKSCCRGNSVRALRMEPLEDRRMLAMVTVSNDLDVVNGDTSSIANLIAPGGDGGDGISLREAIEAANSNPDEDTIKFSTDPADGLDGATIDLKQNLGELPQIIFPVTIDASMLSGDLTIDAGGNSRIFNIYGAPGKIDVTLRGLTLKGGDVSGNGGAILADYSNLTIEASIITGNDATGNGGGIYAKYSSSLHIEDSEVSGNTAGYDGGGIHAQISYSSSLFIEGSEVSGNTASRDGGGVFALAHKNYINPFPMTEVITISQSLISGNTATDRGGGIYTKNLEGTETLVKDSRITGNHVLGRIVHPDPDETGNGGGIYAYLFGNSAETNTPRFTITGSTVDDNKAEKKGGGIFVCGKVFGEFIALNSTISGNDTLDTDLGRGGGIFIARYGDPADLDESVDAFLNNVTITQNVSKSGGGVETADLLGVRARFANSIISGNKDHDENANNFYGRIYAGETEYNLISDDGNTEHTSDQQNTFYDHLTGAEIFFNGLGSGNLDNGGTNVPGLGPLAFYGGLTPTHVLLQGSPAIDAGSDALAVIPFTSNMLTEDQRGTGFTRKIGVVDIGAYEKQIALPRVVDVRLSGSNWTGLDAYSFYSIVADGEQLRPIFTEEVDTLEIIFSESVNMDLGKTDLMLKGVNDTLITSTDFSHVVDSNVATWTFSTPLPDDKYAIHLSTTITAVDTGEQLDGEWINPTNSTPDDYTDDVDDPNYKPIFVSGNDTPGTMAGEFRFHFALLAGDSDGDGIVETDPSGADDDLQAGVLGDIDGDGDPGTAADGIAAELLHGNMLELRTIDGADLNDDEIVDEQDLTYWQTGYGLTTLGDVDGDGDSDGSDFLLWQRAFGTFSAWYTGPYLAGLGGTLPLFLIGTAPTVENVTISGSISIHDSYEFDSVDGSGLQLQTVPVGGADTISIRFNELVNISADSLAIVGLQTGNLPELAEFSYDAMTMTATWRFEGWALADQYLLSLHDSVTDIEGNLLDGEWVNPESISTVNSLVSEFPSGDGTAGGHFNFVMTLLPGDANLDGIVDGLDVSILSSNFNSGELDLLFENADFSGNGIVSIGDLGILSSNFGTNLQNLFVLADLDGDFDVDDNDLQTISDNFGMTEATYADGDLNGDGIIDDSDLDLAFAQFSLAFDWVA